MTNTRLATAVTLCWLVLVLLLAYTAPAPAQPAVQTNQTQVFSAWTKAGRAPDITAAATTGRTILNFAGPVARVCNTGTVAAYVQLGGSAVVATLAASDLVPAGTCVSLNAIGQTYLAAITASSTAVIQTTLGTGQP